MLILKIIAVATLINVVELEYLLVSIDKDKIGRQQVQNIAKHDATDPKDSNVED